jgi:hypothetical protein
MSRTAKTTALVPAAPAISTLVLPAPSDVVGQGDPAFADIRRHRAVMGCGTQLLIGASTLLGAAMNKLRDQIQPAKGRPVKNDNPVAIYSNTPWKELVQVHAGVGHETCRRAEKVASDLVARLRGKRDAESKRALEIMADPTLATGYEDYALISRVAAQTYDADTWTGILIEVGLIRPPVSNPGLPGGAAPKKLTLAQEATIAANGFLAYLRNQTVNAELWRKRLAALPLDPTGDPKTPSLAELRAEIADRLTEVDSVIARKASAA